MAEVFLYRLGDPFGQIRQLTNSNEPSLDGNRFARISGDGRWVTFDSTSNDIVSNPSHERKIVGIDLAIEPPSVAFATSASSCSAPSPPCQSREPSINTDGSRIAFDSDFNFDPTPGNADGNFELHLIIDRTSVSQITGTPAPRSGALHSSIDQAGDTIAFESFQDLDPSVGNADLNGEIFLWDGTTNTFRQVTMTTGSIGGFVNEFPVLSGDGRTTAFISPFDLVPFVAGDPTKPGNADGSIEVFVAVPPNQPPVLDPIGNKTGHEGQLLQFTVSATDPDTGQTLALSASNLPPGSSFPTVQGTSPVSGTFSWTPSCTGAGTFPNVTFTVSDGVAPAVSEVITMTIQVANCLPTITVRDMNGNVVNPGFTLNEDSSTLLFPQLQFQVEATDPDGDTIQLCGRSLPPLATFGGQTFLTCFQTGAPTVSATFSWGPFSLTDIFRSLGNCTTSSFSPAFTVWDAGVGIIGPSFPWPQQDVPITLVKAAVNHPPVAIGSSSGQTSFGQRTGVVGPGKAFELIGTSSCDPDGTPLSYQWSYTGSNPAGITQDQLNLSPLSQATATGTAPNVTVFTSLQFALQVSDGSLQTALAVLLNVVPGCFLATAAYGSPLAPELEVLRAYRDEVLSRSRLGQTFTEAYYTVSPPLARFIADKPLLRALLRQALRPLIQWSKRRLGEPTH